MPHKYYWLVIHRFSRGSRPLQGQLLKHLQGLVKICIEFIWQTLRSILPVIVTWFSLLLVHCAASSLLDWRDSLLAIAWIQNFLFLWIQNLLLLRLVIYLHCNVRSTGAFGVSTLHMWLHCPSEWNESRSTRWQNIWRRGVVIHKRGILLPCRSLEVRLPSKQM